MRIRPIVLAGIAAATAHAAYADSVSTRSASGLLNSQLSVLDGRASEQYSNSIRLQPPRVEVPEAPGSIPVYDGRYKGQLLPLARAAAARNQIPEDLFLRLVQQESGWNPNARSHKGALGLAQLMPATARSLGVNPMDVSQNLEGGARYLRRQYETFGDWRLALAAYNAGPGAVQKYDGVPPYKETQNYVRIILGR